MTPILPMVNKTVKSSFSDAGDIEIAIPLVYMLFPGKNIEYYTTVLQQVMEDT